DEISYGGGGRKKLRENPGLRDWFGLARELGMSAARAQREISYDEFAHWVALYRIEKEERDNVRNGGFN
ncbi:MAG: hypothetical protein MI684_01960, partial [Chlorobiales bacterium]|nr:hypothetical protein [Chlorobiales bacterium]